MSGRTHFHRLLCNIDAGELFELMIHAGQLTLDAFRRIRKFLLDPGDVQINTAVRSASSRLHLAIDASGDVVPGEELRWTARILVALCVPPAFFLVIGGLLLIELGYIV